MLDRVIKVYVEVTGVRMLLLGCKCEVETVYIHDALQLKSVACPYDEINIDESLAL